MRQHLALDAAVEDRIGRLLGAEARQPAPLRHPLRLDDLRGREGRRADRAHLARPHQIGEGRQRLLDVGVRRGPVDLVEIDVVGLQAAQRGLDRLRDPASRIALLVRIVAHRAVHLGGQHDVVAPTLQRLADDLLRLAAAIPVGGVDEVDAEIQGLVDDADAVVVIGIAHCRRTSSRPGSRG